MRTRYAVKVTLLNASLVRVELYETIIISLAWHHMSIYLILQLDFFVAKKPVTIKEMVT